MGIQFISRPVILSMSLVLSWNVSLFCGMTVSLLLSVLWRSCRGSGFERRLLMGMSLGLLLGVPGGWGVEAKDITSWGCLTGSHAVKGTVNEPVRLRERGWSLRMRLSHPVEGEVLVLGRGPMPELGVGALIGWTSVFRSAGEGKKGRQLMSITRAPRVMTLLRPASLWHRWSAVARSKLAELIRGTLPPRAAAWVCALSMGESGLLGPHVKDRFRVLGLSHLLAVSGLHFAFLMGWVWTISRPLMSSCGHWSGRWIRVFSAVVVVTGYYLITRQGPATTRAMFFILTYLVGVLFRKELDAISVLCFALLGLSVMNPETLGDPGTQLSFCGVFSLLLNRWRLSQGVKLNVGNSARSVPRRTFEAASFLVAPWLGTMGLTAFWFGGVAALAPLANAIGIPVMAFLMLPLSLFSAGWLATFGGVPVSEGLLEDLYTGVEDGLIRLDSLLGFWVPLEVSSWFALVMTLTVFMLIGGTRPSARVGAICVFLGCLAMGTFGPGDNAPRITFMNVGHGDAALISDGRGSLLVDGGGTGAGWYAVLDKIRKEHRSGALHLLVSHGDEDHGAGLFPILERVEAVKTLFFGAGTLVDPLIRKLVQVALIRGVQVVEIGAGDVVTLNETLRLNTLWPARATASPSLSRNDRSLVVSVTLMGTSILFTGDIEGPAEHILGRRFRAPTVDILKVAHHGSRTSSSPDFLRWSNPRAAVISQDMHRGHPHRTVLQRFQRRGTPSWLTSYGGEVVFWPLPKGGIAISRPPDTGGGTNP